MDETTTNESEPGTVSDEELKQMFRDILKGPEERKAAFAKLQALESDSKVLYLHNELHGGTKKKKKKKKDIVKRIKSLLQLYLENKEQVHQAAEVGTAAVTAILAMLSKKKK